MKMYAFQEKWKHYIIKQKGLVWQKTEEIWKIRAFRERKITLQVKN